MNSFAILILAIGISLDSFAIMATKGAMLPRIQKPLLFGIGVALGCWQACALLIGNTVIENAIFLSNSNQILLQLLAVLIFIGIGLYMLRKGIKEEAIYEKRMDHIEIKSLFYLAMITSVDAFMVGIGLALLEISLQLSMILSIIVVNVIAVILGVYVGYHLGYEQRTKAYTIGGSILVVFAANIFLNHILTFI